LDKTHIKNKEGLQISESTIEKGKAWQTRLLDSWKRQTMSSQEQVASERNETHLVVGVLGTGGRESKEDTET
jgi:hypothetical protein